MTNEEMINLLFNLEKLDNLDGSTFAYKIIFNKRLLNELYEIYQEMIRYSPDYEEYVENKNKLDQIYADQDSQGKPIIINDIYQIINSKDKYDEEIEKLNIKYKKARDQRQIVTENIKTFLKSESELELKPILRDEIPQNIKVYQMDIIFNLIEN